MRARHDAQRLTDLLEAVGLFCGPVPRLPAGARTAPHVPYPVESALRGIDPVVRARVLDPLGRAQEAPRPGRPVPVLLPELVGATRPGARPTLLAPEARQVDETTCGAAVLAMLRLAGDPAAALALARDPRGARHAFAALQRATQARTRRVWPRRLGTPPWGAARAARYGPVRHTHRVVGSGEPSVGPRAVLAAAVAAASAGIPVPLYTGGDLGHGATTAVPRHVVLLTAVRTGPTGSTATLYEPSSGALHAVPVDALRSVDGAPRQPSRRRALGGWPHVVWAVLPREER
ncbi:hypothetical protein UQW22_18080 [Isoptericola halotolerans]|uniref:hypothetical protein n=1 Tax=Isoptericola halotolerans TaxID=300560 RepID=UPI00388E6DBC